MNTPSRRKGRPIAGLLEAALGATAALLAQPTVAHACAVCFGGRDSNWTAGFVAGTIVMLALPPALIGTAAFLVYRAIKRQEARRAAAQTTEAARAGAAPTSGIPVRVTP